MDNAGLGPNKPSRWLGVEENQGTLMCYHILNENAKVTSRYSVQQASALEPQTEDHSKTFNEFEDKIRLKLKEKTDIQ